MLKTFTGRVFDYNNITKDSIDISDVMRALPSINRFLGHSMRPYSVAEHTIRGYNLCCKLGYTPLQKLHWLIHDFTEAYMGDCPTPLKQLLPEFSVYEEKVEMAILEHLGLEQLTEEEYNLMKRIDSTMLVIEMRDLTLHDYKDYIDENVYLDMLDDEYSKIGHTTYDNEVTTKTLKYVFNTLMTEVKGESFKCLEI